MNEEIRNALMLGPGAPMGERIIDITTTGRRSGQPRRIKTVFYPFEDAIYLSGLPGPKPRAWLLNLAAEPRFTFHLKHAVVADLPATAEVIDDPAERERIFSTLVSEFNRRRDPNGPYPEGVLEQWVAASPLAKVSFLDGD